MAGVAAIDDIDVAKEVMKGIKHDVHNDAPTHQNIVHRDHSNSIKKLTATLLISSTAIILNILNILRAAAKFVMRLWVM